MFFDFEFCVFTVVCWKSFYLILCICNYCLFNITEREGVILNNSIDILKDLKSKFNAEYTFQDKFLFIKIPDIHYYTVAKNLKARGFKRLLTVSAIDWLERGKFEVYFLLYNPSENLYAKVSTEIPRKEPKIQSLSDLWENSAMHERETWELFGIVFEGNLILKPLLLEAWRDIPPFRKDFNSREYVEKVYGKKW